MGRQSNKISYLVGGLFVLLTGMFGCHEAQPTRESVPKEAPGEWMFAQRAFPHGALNRKVMEQAVSDARAAATRTRSQMDPWEAVGPSNIGGRITSIAFHPGDTNILYAGASVGGLWKSDDKGATWQLVFQEYGAISLGAVHVATADPQTIYIGTGEANGGYSSGAFFGNGVYKSIDGGVNWTHMGLTGSDHVGRITTHPDDADVVWVAASGTLYGKNNVRGVYRSDNGGEEWEQSLFVSDSTACIDLVINPDNPNVLYAAMWERLRFAHFRRYGGTTSAIQKTTDGGKTWSRLTNGLPTGPEVGRIGLALSPVDANKVYASYTRNPIRNDFDGLYQSTDAGTTWSRIDDGQPAGIYSGFGWFFGQVRVDEQERVYLLAVNNWRSENGMDHWSPFFASHVDHHAFEIHPAHRHVQVAGTDGGVYMTSNAWSTAPTTPLMPITQFYACAIDPIEPSTFYGGTQDNGTVKGSDGQEAGFERILGADGFRVIIDPTDNTRVYAETQWGGLYKFEGDDARRSVNGISTDDRKNWNTAIALDNSRPYVLYYGTQRLYRSVDRADNWEPITGDLTNPALPVGRGDQFGTISTIALAPSDDQTIYVGTDDGYVQVSFDEGATWEVVSDDIPDRYITSIAVDALDPMIAYVTISGFRDLDYMPHIYRTTDGGANWVSIAGNLPEMPLNDVIIDTDLESTLYVAGDLGVWYTSDLGLNWEPLGIGLPPVVVNDLDFHAGERLLLAATYGRSLYKYELGFETTTSTASNDKRLELYPNPSSGQVNLQLEGTSAALNDLQVFDVNGRLIKSIRMDAINGTGSIPIDLSNLYNGQYFLTIYLGETRYTGHITIVN